MWKTSLFGTWRTTGYHGAAGSTPPVCASCRADRHIYSTTAHPLYARSAQRIGAPISEATTRPNPTVTGTPFLSTPSGRPYTRHAGSRSAKTRCTSKEEVSKIAKREGRQIPRFVVHPIPEFETGCDEECVAAVAAVLGALATDHMVWSCMCVPAPAARRARGRRGPRRGCRR
jgi:hypothetical protein